MAVAFGATIGEIHSASSGSTKSLTTNAAVPAGAKIILNVQSYRGTAISSISGGGLTWSIDKQQAATSGDTGVRAHICSADAPSGLASGTSITVTFSGIFDTCGIQGYYITGAATASPVDATGGAGTTGTTAAANVVTTNANDFLAESLYVIFVIGDITPAASITEVYDVAHADGNKHFCGYRILSATGTYNVGGSWSGSNVWAVAGVAYKAAATTTNSGFFRLMRG